MLVRRKQIAPIIPTIKPAPLTMKGVANSGRKLITIIPSILGFFIALYCFLSVKRGYDEYFILTLVYLSTILIIVQGINNYLIRKRKSWFQIDIMFLIMFFFVHFWLWLAIHYKLTDFMWVSNSYLKNVNYSVALSLLGMTAFILGYNSALENHKASDTTLMAASHWKKTGYIIFYSGAILTVLYAFYFGAQAFTGNYTGSAVGGLLTRSIYLLQGILLKLGILIILITHADKNKIIPNCKLPIIILAVVLSMLLILGDRSEFIYTLSVVLFAYARFYKKITLPVMVVGIMTIAFLMSVVQVARTAKNRSLSELSDVMLSHSQDTSVLQGLNGISASAGVLLGGVTAIPEKYDYFMGELKIVELLGIVPYGRALLLDGDTIGKYGTSSQFLTWYMLGPDSKTGTGTTIVADIYVDFGPIGVVLALFLLGYIANYSYIKVDKSSSIMGAVVFCYFAGLLVMMPRYSFLMIIRGLIWPTIIMWLIKSLFISKTVREIGEIK